MLKRFSTLLCFFFLLFPNSMIAEDSPDTQKETSIEETPAATDVEEISEAQKEADAAEAAELREAGIEEEPPLD